MVIVERRPDGKIKIHQVAGDVATGAASGAIWGGLIGRLFLAPLIGTIGGAAAGGMTEAGVSEDFVKQLGEALQPGYAAVVALGQPASMDKLVSSMSGSGHITQIYVTGEQAQMLDEALHHAGHDPARP